MLKELQILQKYFEHLQPGKFLRTLGAKKSIK